MGTASIRKRAELKLLYPFKVKVKMLIYRRLRCERGLTLVELLMTFAMLGFVIAALYSFYLAGVNSWNRAGVRLEQQQTARIALDQIIGELRYASEVEIRSGNPEMIYFRKPVDDRMRLHRFRLNGNQLVFEGRTESDNHHSYNVIALGLSDLIFTIDDNGLVGIYLKVSDGERETAATGSVYPFNSDLTVDGVSFD